MSKIEFKKDGINVGGIFYPLDDVVSECNKIKISEGNLQLLIIKWRGWRGFDGCKEEIVLPAENIKIITRLMLGNTVYFGEICGKHSDVYNTVDEEDIEIISDKEKIDKFLLTNPSGHSYDHSFIHQFADSAIDGQYDDITEEQVDEFVNAFKQK